MTKNNNEWTDCKDAMPAEEEGYDCTYSPMVEVMLTTGKTDEDWTINGKWTLHCKKDTEGGYPVKWRYFL